MHCAIWGLRHRLTRNSTLLCALAQLKQGLVPSHGPPTTLEVGRRQRPNQRPNTPSSTMCSYRQSHGCPPAVPRPRRGIARLTTLLLAVPGVCFCAGLFLSALLGVTQSEQRSENTGTIPPNGQAPSSAESLLPDRQPRLSSFFQQTHSRFTPASYAVVPTPVNMVDPVPINPSLGSGRDDLQGSPPNRSLQALWTGPA